MSKFRRESSGVLGWWSQGAQYYAPLALFFRGRRQFGDVVVDRFSFRWDGAKAWAVSGGLRVTDMTRVVAFGSGATPLDALRNLCVAITKVQWKKDKFADFV